MGVSTRDFPFASDFIFFVSLPRFFSSLQLSSLFHFLWFVDSYILPPIMRIDLNLGLFFKLSRLTWVLILWASSLIVTWSMVSNDKRICKDTESQGFGFSRVQLRDKSALGFDFPDY